MFPDSFLKHKVNIFVEFVLDPVEVFLGKQLGEILLNCEGAPELGRRLSTKVGGSFACGHLLNWLSSAWLGDVNKLELLDNVLKSQLAFCM